MNILTEMTKNYYYPGVARSGILTIKLIKHFENTELELIKQLEEVFLYLFWYLTLEYAKEAIDYIHTKTNLLNLFLEDIDVIFGVHDSYELIKYIRLTYPDTYDKIVEELLKEQYFENNLFQLLNEKKMK